LSTLKLQFGDNERWLASSQMMAGRPASTVEDMMMNPEAVTYDEENDPDGNHPIRVGDLFGIPRRTL
jgi:hypothetical protein